MTNFWKFLNLISLVLILALAGYWYYNRTTPIEPEDPQVVVASRPAGGGIFDRIKQLFSPDRQKIPPQAPALKPPAVEDTMPRLEPPVELQEHLQNPQRQAMPPQQIDTGTFVATRQPNTLNTNIPVVTEKIWQEGHWIGLEVGPLTPALAKANGVPQDVKGVLVDEVTLLAAASGILAGDVITAINDRPTPDLYAFKEATRPIAMSNRAVVTVYRAGMYKKVEVISNEELGLAQMEAAPMINATDVSPHSYYGPCERCHAISKTAKNTGQMAKDGGDVLMKVAPPIKWGVKPIHENRGTCTNCHKVI